MRAAACSGRRTPISCRRSRKRRMAERSWFDRFAAVSADALGTPAAFSAAGAVVGWALTGPLFHWSDTWRLVINTSTTVVTFLAVFLIQHTQNRDTAALQLKVDE